MFTPKMKEIKSWKEFKSQVVTLHKNQIKNEKQSPEELREPVVTTVAVFFKDQHTSLERNIRNALTMQIMQSDSMGQNIMDLDEIKAIYPDSWNVRYVVMMNLVEDKPVHITGYFWSAEFEPMRAAIARKEYDHLVQDMCDTPTLEQEPYQSPKIASEDPKSLTELNEQNCIQITPAARRAVKVVAALRDVSVSALVTEAIWEKLEALSMVDKSVAVMYNKFVHETFDEIFSNEPDILSVKNYLDQK